jgi:hypothetical protein
MPRFFLVLLAALVLSCRDEQAGPAHRTPNPGMGTAATAPVLDVLPTNLTYRRPASWANGAIEYLGARVSPSSSDGTVQISNFFRANRDPPAGYSLFMHIVDAQTGQFLTNADHSLPLPNGTWPVGKIVEDAFRMRVPPGRSLQFLIGFFRDNQRLPLDARSMHDGQMRAWGPVIGQAQPLAEYPLHRLKGTIQIDGDLRDVAWQDATPVKLTRSLDGGPVTRATTARLLYDDHFLYVAFDCEDDDVWGTFRQNDDPIYTQEAVEIFLDSNADGATYHELEVSPHNVLFDAYFPARRTGMDLSWKSDAVSAVKVRGSLDDDRDHDDGLSVELKIPFDHLKDLPVGSPKAGARWRFNLYRLEQIGRKNTEGQAYSPPLIGDFHNLPRFAWLVFQ